MLPQKENGPNELEIGTNSTPRRSLRIKNNLPTLSNTTKSDLSTFVETGTEKITDSDLLVLEESAANSIATIDVAGENEDIRNSDKSSINLDKIQQEPESSRLNSELADSKSEECNLITGCQVTENATAVKNNKQRVEVNEIERREENGPSDDIHFQIDRLIESYSSSDDESSLDENSFIDFEAEEGEEDTPSDDSNAIPERGEDINTTESDYSSDGSYDRNSFIDDEDTKELLSGDEYDLSLEEPKKQSRIIKFSSGSDDEIIPVERFTKPVKKRKKSRIIKPSDSSEDELDCGFVDFSSNTERKPGEKTTDNNTKNEPNCSDNNLESTPIVIENCNTFNESSINEDTLQTFNEKDEIILETNTNDKIKIVQVIRIENGVSQASEESENTTKEVPQKICVFTQFEKEESCYKQNKKRKLSSGAVNKNKRIKTTGIVEDAIQDQKKFFVESNLHELPNVIASNPQVSSKNSVQNKLQKSPHNKFHHKDFKNMMVYDCKRVKRISTNNMLKKKCQ